MIFAGFYVSLWNKCEKQEEDLEWKNYRLSILNEDYNTVTSEHYRNIVTINKLIGNIDNFVEDFNSWHAHKIQFYHDGNEWVIYYDA